jgi:hypothetical protein
MSGTEHLDGLLWYTLEKKKETMVLRGIDEVAMRGLIRMSFEGSKG